MDGESPRFPEATPDQQDIDKEPTLPGIPGIPRFPDVYRGTKSATNPRKRLHTEDASLFLSTSSDPAVFSSDDDPALENVGRRKKRYVGSWFQQVPASSDSAIGEDMQTSPSLVVPKRKRTLRRQFDSGVYMGHVGSIDSSDGEPDEEIIGDGPDGPDESDGPEQPNIDESDDSHAGDSEEDLEALLRNPGPYRLNPHSDACYRRLAIERAMPKYGADEAAIQNYFQALIEQGEETVDLSNIGMNSVSNATVSLLSGLVRIPTVIEDVEFEQPETSINLIMSNNRLIRVPTAIFELEHLTTLSLRGNKLVELPPSISQCKSLRTLNVSFNRLRYLPGELLELIKEGGSLRELHLFGNPFYVRKRTTPQTDNPEEGNPDDYGPSRLYRTPVQYTDASGAVYSDFRLDDRKEVDLEPDWQLTPPRRHQVPTRVPSLLELALRSASRASKNDASLAAHLGPAGPDRLRALLDAAAADRYQGGRRCRSCGRGFVRPRARWLEFDTSGDASGGGPLVQVKIVGAPFLWAGCSWRCVPAVVPRAGGEAGS